MSPKNIGFIDLVAFGAFRSLRVLFRLLPRRACLALGGALGRSWFRISRTHRRLALANLEIAFGHEFSALERRRIGRDSFSYFVRAAADNLKWTYLRDERRAKLLAVEGKEHILGALGQGRGALLFSAHFGNWEVAALAVARLGKLNVVARALDNPLVESELARFRNSLGARIISKFQAARPILQALHRNEIVAILIDQNVLRSQAVFVDFFGREAATTPALASFYLRTRSPLIPLFCYPTPSSEYLVKIGKPLSPELSGDLERDVLKITQACTKMIEAEIRANPSLWFWFHNRWKTRPENQSAGPPGPAAGLSEA
ncbi:MAG: lysophospholipid acyltransferase family protein [Acidobacteriota bacterium]